MGLSNLFYRSPRLLSLTLLIISVAGFASLKLLPRTETPAHLAQRQIFTLFPGADAARTEALVTDVIEDMLAEYQEIKEIKSISRAGISTMPSAPRRHRRDRADLDGDARRPGGAATGARPARSSVRRVRLAAYTWFVGLTWDLEGPPEREVLGRLAEDLADELRTIPGQRRGGPRSARGGADRADPGRLAAAGLDAASVSRAILASDAKVAAGEIVGAVGDPAGGLGGAGSLAGSVTSSWIEAPAPTRSSASPTLGA